MPAVPCWILLNKPVYDWMLALSRRNVQLDEWNSCLQLLPCKDVLYWRKHILLAMRRWNIFEHWFIGVLSVSRPSKL